MYHQFMQLANLDITKANGNRPDDPLRHGRGRGRGPRCRASPGFFAAEKCAAGLHGANRLGGNSLSDLLVFGKRRGEFAAKYRKGKSRRPNQRGANRRQRANRRAGFEAGRNHRRQRRGPYQVQHDLQNMMQELVGIVRREDEMSRALGLGHASGSRRKSRVLIIANTIPAGTPRST